MEVLKLIKKRKTIRKYKSKLVPRKLIHKIIEAGIWGPSVPSFLQIQPWRFVIVTNKKLKTELYKILFERSQQEGIGVNILLRSASDIVNSAQAVVLIYNSGDIQKYEKKFKIIYAKFAAIIAKAELCAISAAVQNMILIAEELGIGSCWLDTPLFCKKEINKIININDELVAILALGYADEKGKRSPRKPISEAVKFVI